MTPARTTYWVSLGVPLLLIAALAVVLGAVLAEHCGIVLFTKGHLLECKL